MIADKKSQSVCMRCIIDKSKVKSYPECSGAKREII